MNTNGNIKVIEPVDDYKRIHKSIIRNKKIDCLTLGIYCKIVVLGADWQLNIKGLSKILGVSDNKVRASIGILEREGYIKREANYHDNRLYGWVYNVYSEPVEEKERSRAGYNNNNDFTTQCCAESSVTQNQTTLETDITENGQDNNIRPNIIENLKDSKTNNNIEEKELKEKFAEFVSLYRKAGGRVRGVDTEFEEFSKRHKDWQTVIPYLEIALQREIKARNQAKARKAFFPEMKMLRTYLGQKRAWEYYVTIGEDITQEEYTPVCEGSLSWNDYYKCYIYVGFWNGYIPDGYADDDRPDGASVMLNNARGTAVWDKNTKTWQLINTTSNEKRGI